MILKIKEIEIKIFDNNDDVDINESKNKSIQNKYNHKKGDCLAIIPEGENKKYYMKILSKI